MKNSFVNAALALVAGAVLASCVQDAGITDPQPTFEVTFGLSDETTQHIVQSDTTYERPIDILFLSMFDTFGDGTPTYQNYWGQGDFAAIDNGTLTVPGIPAGEYDVNFNTWNFDGVIKHTDREEWPLYMWVHSMPVPYTEDEVIEVHMDHISGKLSIEGKDDQILDDSLYSKVEVQYDVKYTGTMHATGQDTHDWYEDGLFKMNQNETYYHVPNTLVANYLKLYDATGVLVNTVDLEALEFDIEEGKHTILVVDFDELANGTKQGSGAFIFSWEVVEWTEEIVNLN